MSSQPWGGKKNANISHGLFFFFTSNLSIYDKILYIFKYPSCYNPFLNPALLRSIIVCDDLNTIHTFTASIYMFLCTYKNICYLCIYVEPSILKKNLPMSLRMCILDVHFIFTLKIYIFMYAYKQSTLYLPVI